MLRRSVVAAASAAAGGRSRALSTLEPAPALVYSEHGDPEKVLTFVDDAGAGNASDPRFSSPTSTSVTPSPPSASSVLVRWLASPVNWSDVNVVEGTYPGAPRPPATPGNEGAGIVEQVFFDDDEREEDENHQEQQRQRRLKPGDLVVPLVPAAGALGGTWRRFSVASPRDLHRVDPALGLSAEQAATLCINPPTALHLLEDFVSLKPGDSLIQTGATTAVGKLVVQLAASRGVSTINVVRDRGSPGELERVKAELVRLGGGGGGDSNAAAAVVVVSESEIAGKRSVKELLASLSSSSKLSSVPPPMLGLNCVGGSAATSAMRLLDGGGGATLVTYGGLSRKPLAVPASALIFKGIRVVGYWLSRGLQQQQQQQQQQEEGEGGKGKDNDNAAESREARLAARRRDVDRVASLVSEGTISTEVEKVPLRDWRDAVAALRRGGAGAKKQVLVP